MFRPIKQPDRLKLKTTLTRLLIILVILTLQWLQLESSAHTMDQWKFLNQPMLILANWALICLPNLILVTVLRKWTVSLTVSSAICTVLSVANHYVVLYHGSPMAPRELANLGTALAVAGGYDYSLDTTVLLLAAAGVLELGGIFLLSREKIKTSGWKPFVRDLVMTAACAAALYGMLFSGAAVKPARTITWSWQEAMQNYGYLCCLVEDACLVSNPCTMPDGYDVSLIAGDVSKDGTEAASQAQKPDIILILNESFFDLERRVDLQTDSDYLASFYNVEGAVYGYAAGPNLGGGTNNTEYELLTGNSMYLLNSSAPFNYLDLSKSGANLASYLNELGYTTHAMHPAAPTNYSRHIGYPAMGFDQVLLGSSYYTRFGKNGDRYWLDWDNYLDMLDYYEAESEAPRFFYMLTYQNHGGFSLNDDSLDTVHTGLDLGDVTSEVNEYLSSVTLSAQAFADLTAYFSTVNRPVIVCMVGDHAPPFITELPFYEGLTSKEVDLISRSTPYAVWANYDADLSFFPEQISMVDLAPLLVKAAGLPLCAYYRTILQITEQIPVRKSSGEYLDSDGQWGNFAPGSPYYELLREYYYMEYNNIMAGDDYLPELFRP